MASRAPSRLQVAGMLLAHPGRWLQRRHAPDAPRSILIPQVLLLGDTLLLTPLLAKLRRRWPEADIAMTVGRALSPLYAGRPYGVRPLQYDPRDRSTLAGLRTPGGWDLALLPADNRFGYLARAVDCHWVTGFAADVPDYKNWGVDMLRPLPTVPVAFGDMAAELVDGPEPPPYATDQWPAVPASAFDHPARGRHAVLHVGASTSLKSWPAANWTLLARRLRDAGLEVVWSAGRGEMDQVAAIDPERTFPSLAGALDLPQMWRLLAGADLLVCPDTGIAHMGRLAGVPTVTLFGPGSADIYGAGRFWRESPYRAAWVRDFPCRDQAIMFRRSMSWVRRCERDTRQCAGPRCMEAIGVDAVWREVSALLPGLA